MGTGLAGWAAVGCGSGDGASATDTDSGDSDGAGAGTRTVDQYEGTVEVPAEPANVVTLDTGASLQVALELGAPLVGASVLQGDVPIPPYLPEPVQDFEHLPWFTELNLEQLQLLEPDLIIGHPPAVEENADLLADIAPTATYANSAVGVAWRESCLQVADFLGQRDAEQQLIDDYEAKAAEFAETYRDVLEQYTVALVRFTTEELRIITESVIFGSQVLSDCGVQRSQSSRTDDPEETYISLAQEEVGMLDDADVIIWFGGGGGFADGDAGKVFTTYTESTLWQRLPAVESGRFFEVPEVSWWDGSSPTAASTCIDELTEIFDQL